MSDNVLTQMVAAVRQRRPVFYIASHPLFLERRRRELLHHTGGYANVHWFTWNQWVDHLLHGQGRSYVRLSPNTRQDIVESLLHQLQRAGRLPNLAPGLLHPGMSKSVALWIEDLTKETVPAWAERFANSQDAVQMELHEVACVYFDWTSQPTTPFKERRQLEELVAPLLEADAHFFAEHGAAVFFLEGEMGETDSQRHLLHVLQSRLANCVTDIRPSTWRLQLPSLPIRWFELPHDQAEVRALVSDVKQTLHQGVSLSDILIVVPTEAYRRKVTRELKAHRLPCRKEAHESLIHRGAVQKILSLLQMKRSHWSREVLLAACDRFATSAGMSERAFVWGKELICQSGVQEGAEAWRELFRANWGRSRKRLSFLQEQGVEASEAEPRLIGQRLEAAAQWLRLLSRFRRLLEAIPESGTWREYLQGTMALVKRLTKEDPPVYETLRQLLREREEIEQAISPEDGDPIRLHRFTRWLLERVQTTPVETKAEEGLLVCLPEEAYGGRFASVHVLGLAEEVFPSTYAPHWIWERGGVADRFTHVRSERHRLQQVVQTATGALSFYTPQTTGRRQPVVPNQDLSKQLGEPEQREDETRLRRKGSPMQVGEAQAVPLYVEGQTLHVTGLDLYRRCAFRYFADRVLRVQSKIERSIGLTPPDIGSILHLVLKKWVEARGETAADRVALAEQLLAEELDAFAGRWQMAGTIWNSQRERIRQELLRFISQEEVFLAQPGVESIGEWGFGIVHQEKMAASSTPEPLVLRQGEQTVRLCGIVDRIDVGADGCSVHDYKLSRGPTVSEMAEGVDLQVALYLLAYHRLQGSTPLRGRYALLRDPGASRDVSFAGESTAVNAFFERVEQRVFSLLGRMKSGDATPQPWKNDECQRCSYQHTCRQAERGMR